MYTTEKEQFLAQEQAAARAGKPVTRLSELIGRPAREWEFRNQLDEYSFFAVDLIFRDDGAVVLQEANGSNGASTGMQHDGQRQRARHMVQTALSRGLPRRCVVLLTHADETSLLPEFQVRQQLIAEEFVLQSTRKVRMCEADEALGLETLSVVRGRVTSLLPHLTVNAGHLHYRGRPVGFAANCNILPALQRAGVVEHGAAGWSVETGVFHEGRRGVEIVLDKSEQQRVAANTGVTPLRHTECATWETLASEIAHWHSSIIVPVAKINSGSQGVGVEFFPLNDITPVAERIHAMRESAQRAYGANADATVLPVRLFEFAASTRYAIDGGGHLWDVRIECRVSPGVTKLIPTTMRICPAPFDGSFARDSILSNLSGRAPSLEFVRAPFDHHAAGVTELMWAGVSEDCLRDSLESLAAWCESALKPKVGAG